MWILTGMCLILLGICTYTDIKRREIFWSLPLLYLLFALLYRGMNGFWWLGVTELILRLLPGTVLLLIRLLRKRWIGAGDGLLVLCCGYALGAETVLQMLSVAFFAAAVCAGILLAVKKRNRKDTLPFVPFLLTGCVIVSVLQLIGEMGK